MHFCSNCDNMYYIKISNDDNNKLIYYCRNCGTEDLNLGKENIYISKVDLSSSDNNYLNFINEYTKFDPTLPRVSNIPCPNESCPCNTDPKNHAKEVILIRYNESELNYIYLCAHCDKAWKL